MRLLKVEESTNIIFAYCYLVLQLAVETELRSLELQASSLRKQHDKLVQDRLSSKSKLAHLKDNIRVTIFISALSRNWLNVFSLYLSSHAQLASEALFWRACLAFGALHFKDHSA